MATVLLISFDSFGCSISIDGPLKVERREPSREWYAGFVDNTVDKDNSSIRMIFETQGLDVVPMDPSLPTPLLDNPSTMVDELLRRLDP